MSNKIQLRVHVEKLNKDLDRIEQFTRTAAERGLEGADLTFVYDAALVKAWVVFEKFMLTCLVAAINHDSSTISERSGVDFPAHLKMSVCEYLVTGGGYFNFNGFGGLVGTAKDYLPDEHWLPRTLQRKEKDKGKGKDKSVYAPKIELFAALRNFAAHESPQSQARARELTGRERLKSAGVWLKGDNQFEAITSTVRQLANELELAAVRA